MNAEKMILLSQKLVMFSLTKDNEERKRLTTEIARLNSELTDETISNEKTVYCRPLKFTDKEISKMPKTFKKEFRVEGCTAHIRKRCDGKYICSYEIRYRRNGHNISVSARTIEKAKERFIKKLQEITVNKDRTGPKVPVTFNEFALFWFDNFHKRKVVAKTYQINLQRFTKVIAPRFVNLLVKQINAKDIQDLIDEYVTKGMGKTAEETYSLLKQIFIAAVKFGLIIHNPVDMVFHKKHESKHGKALTLIEEHKLLSESAGTAYQRMFAVSLYTGMRPNEFYHAEIRGDFIVTINSKRKNGEKAIKRIPIIKMLRPYLDGVDKLEWYVPNRIREKFKQILPEHHLYDLRTTFYTHCVMCGVAEGARDEMIGHSGGVLKDTYTDLPDEYLLKEAEKLVW